MTEEVWLKRCATGVFADEEVLDLADAAPRVRPPAFELRWNPWSELRRRQDIRLRWGELDGTEGLIVSKDHGETFTIWLDVGMSRRRWTEVLAHELVHAERGVLPVGAPEDERQAEEERVWDEVARRLVPLPELAWMLAAFYGSGKNCRSYNLTRHTVAAIDPGRVGDHFDVSAYLAALALRLLRRGARDLAILTRRVEVPTGADVYEDLQSLG